MRYEISYLRRFDADLSIAVSKLFSGVILLSSHPLRALKALVIALQGATVVQQGELCYLIVKVLYTAF
jgi:hypothetical protein